MRSIRLIIPMVALLGIAFLTQGCMTMARGTTQEIVIKSTPSGANVEITGPRPRSEVVEISGGTAYIKPKVEWKAVGKTPIEIRLRRDQTYKVKIWMDGFKMEEGEIKRRVSPWFWLDCLCTGIVGGLIDLSSGAAFDLEPGGKIEFHKTLRKVR